MGRRAVGPASAEGTAPVRGAEDAGRAIVVVRMGRAWRYRPRRGSALVGGRFVPCCGGALWSPASGESPSCGGDSRGASPLWGRVHGRRRARGRCYARGRRHIRPVRPVCPAAGAGGPVTGGTAAQKGGRRGSFTPRSAPLASRSGAMTPFPVSTEAVAHPKVKRQPPFPLRRCPGLRRQGRRSGIIPARTLRRVPLNGDPPDPASGAGRITCTRPAGISVRPLPS